VGQLSFSLTTNTQYERNNNVSNGTPAPEAVQEPKAPRPPKAGRKHAPVVKKKETDQTVMQKTLEAHGTIRLNVYVKIRHHNVATYVGFRNSGITVDAPTLKLAREFPERLKSVVARLAQDMGLTLPRAVMVDKTD
jgi:hypothetical protein